MHALLDGGTDLPDFYQLLDGVICAISWDWTTRDENSSLFIDSFSLGCVAVDALSI